MCAKRSVSKSRSERVKQRARPTENSLYHESIAIIKREAIGRQSNSSPTRFDYLILCDALGDYHFLDQVNRAIGAGFDLTGMIERIKNYFVMSDGDFKSKEFFLNTRTGTGATAYSFTLTKSQDSQIDVFLSIKGSAQKAMWVTEDTLSKYIPRWRKRQRFLFERGASSFTQPKFSAQLRTNIRNIVKAKNSGRLVVFAGAGVSIDSNVPGWNFLIEQLRSDLDQADKKNDVLKTPQLYLRERRKKEYQERIQEILKHPQTKFNPIHQKILELRPQHIITSNYDPHFEQAILGSSHRYSIVKKDGDLPYSKGGSLLVKMHGDFDERNIVLAEQDYTDYSENFPLIESFVKAVFSSSLVLFVGFSFNDPNLKEILRSVNDILKADSQPPYLLIIPASTTNLKDLKKRESERKRLVTEQLNVVSYEAKPVEKYFEQIRNPQDDRRLKLLGKTGQSVYKFLRVIELFDLSSDAIDGVDVGHQLTLSIKRFDEFGAIPIDTIKQLIPLRLKGQSKYSNSRNATSSPDNPTLLKTMNEELLTYLKGRSKQGVVTFSSNTLEKELGADAAFRLLVSSAVRSIMRGNDLHSEVYRIKSSKADIKCRCMRCLYENLELWDLLQEGETLATRCISAQEKSELGGLQAWSFFKTGQPVRSYYVLEELKVRAQQEQKHVTYYLACLNQMNLRPFLLYQPNTPTKELDEIRASIQDVDLDRLLNELPIDPDVRSALLSLRMGKGMDSARSNIRDSLESMQAIYAGYKRGGYRMSGSVHWCQAETNAYAIWNLFNKNHLLYDEFGEFRRMMQNYIDCMLLTWATPAEYEQRMPNLTGFFTFVFTEYGKTEWLIERIGALEIKSIKLSSDIREGVLDRFANFLNSGFEKQHFFGPDILKRTLFERACEGSAFHTRVRDIMNNHLVLLSLLDLSKDEAREVLERVLNFLSVSSCFGGARTHKAFLRFVRAFSQKFDGSDFERLIKYSLSDNIWTGDILPELCGSIRVANSLFKTKAGTYDHALDRTRRKDWRTELVRMKPLYRFLIGDEQHRMKEDLALDRLIENERTEVLRSTYAYEIWNPTDDPDLWRAYCLGLAKELRSLKDFTIADDGSPRSINNFGPWNGIQSLIRMAYEHELRDSEECHAIMAALKSDMFKWMLRPESFNYAKFKHRWLLAFQDVILDRMKWPEEMVSAIQRDLCREFIPGVAKALYRHLASSHPADGIVRV